MTGGSWGVQVRWRGGGGGSEDRSAVFRPSAALQYLSFPLSFSGLILPFFSPPSSLPVFIYLFICFLFSFPPPTIFIQKKTFLSKRYFSFANEKHISARAHGNARAHARPRAPALWFYIYISVHLVA